MNKTLQLLLFSLLFCTLLAAREVITLPRVATPPKSMTDVSPWEWQGWANLRTPAMQQPPFPYRAFGAYDEQSCDLSDFVLPAALAVAKGECDRGIFVDGVGYGSALIANKINGCYAADAERSGPGTREGTRKSLHRKDRGRDQPEAGR